MTKMKRILLISLLLCGILCVQVQADERKDAVGKFRLVPSVMVTYNPYKMSGWAGRDYLGPTSNFQFGIGVETEYRFHESFGLALGANYLQQGIKLSEPGSGGTLFVNSGHEYDKVLRSWNVPIFLCVHPAKNDCWALKFGYQFDFLQNDEKYFNDLSRGYAFGIAYIMDIVQFELRYNKGINDIVKRSSRCSSAEKNCLMLSVGVVF